MPLKDHKNATQKRYTYHPPSPKDETKHVWNVKKKVLLLFCWILHAHTLLLELVAVKLPDKSLVKWDSQTCRNHAYSARSSLKNRCSCLLATFPQRFDLQRKIQCLWVKGHRLLFIPNVVEKMSPKRWKMTCKIDPSPGMTFSGWFICSALNGSVGWIPY